MAMKRGHKPKHRQMDIFADRQPEPPFQRDYATSKEAAMMAEPVAGTQRAKVLAYIRTCGDVGATDQEIMDKLGMVANSVHPRRGELEKAGLIRDSGRTRHTNFGRSATVWVAVATDWWPPKETNDGSGETSVRSPGTPADRDQGERVHAGENRL